MDLLKMFNTTKNDKRTILAVDDQPDILDTLKKFLKLEYNVYCMTTAEAALKFLKTRTPDLILLDIEMPDMNGIELLEILRDMDKLKNVPIVFLTGNSGMDNLQEVALGGADGFIQKPVDFKFVKRIEKYIK